jgi:branched-chain amino acid transport system substrate-binding protein
VTRTLWRWLALVAVLLLVAAACGDDDDDDDTASGSGDTGSTEASDETAATGDGSADTTATDDTAATDDTGATGGPTEGLRGVTDTTITVGGLSQLANYAGIEEGAAARFERANAEGGVNGRTIEFLGVRDDGSDSTQNLNLTRELVESDEVFAVLPVASANFLPQSTDYLAEQQTIFMGWGFMPGFCGDYGFGFNGCLIGNNLGIEGYPYNSSLVDTAIELAGGEGTDATGLTLGIIAGDDDSGRGGNVQYEALWTARGGDVVYSEAAIPVGGADDYSPFVTDLSQADDGDWPDVIFVSTDFPSAIGMHASLAAAGYPGVAMNFAAYVPGLLQSSADIAAAFEGSYAYTQVPPQEGGGAAIDQILADLDAAGFDPFIGLGTSIGWYAADQFIQMLEAAGPDLGGSMQGFVDAINAGFTYAPPDGGVGEVTFPEGHTTPVPCAAVMHVVDGAYEVGVPFGCYENIEP